MECVCVCVVKDKLEFVCVENEWMIERMHEVEWMSGGKRQKGNTIYALWGRENENSYVCVIV